MSSLGGILNIYKEVGITSHDVVAGVRRALHEKRVGHAGTLDPAAEGVLPVCVGQATRIVEYLTDTHKVYCADIVLGITSDTYDREGVVTTVKEVPDFSLEQIETVLQKFRGPIDQVPPIYSAIKVQGQPLYKMARAGKSAEIELKPRPVEIFELTMALWQRPWLKLWIECSKGTYIRSLAYDIGEALGCGAYMHHLVRVQSGPFHLSTAITLASLAQIVEAGQLEQVIWPIDSVLQDWPVWIVDAATATRLRQGRNLEPSPEFGWQVQTIETQVDRPFRRAYTKEGELLALLEREGNEWHPAKVFNE
jgi:tRNA pseudouridine55 synthase